MEIKNAEHKQLMLWQDDPLAYEAINGVNMPQLQLFEDASSKNRIEIYKGIEFELEKLLDLRTIQKETAKWNYSDPTHLYKITS